jgi:ankyrin repeat protein
VSVASMVVALHAGDPDKVEALVRAGNDPRYRREGGYDALIDAVHGRDVLADPRLPRLIEFLIAQGVALDGVSKHHESALRVLSHIGRFDMVERLLRAGAPAEHIRMTALMEAVALGTLGEVDALSRETATLEAIDYWHRTAWLIAILVGDIAKARLLLERGANPNARGWCDHPPLHYAIDGRHPRMLRWLLANGQEVEQQDRFGTPALIHAAEGAQLECVEILLAAGADIERMQYDRPAVHHARTWEIAKRLMDAGADPQHLSAEARRGALGLPGEPDEKLLDAPQAAFERARNPRRGRRNPEEIDEPFWSAMIRAGVNGYAGNKAYNGRSSMDEGPVWCAQRFGQSFTPLPDGRIVQVAGEHEDYYDPDFYIYNDVFAHAPDGSVRILCYPEDVFPPTDFHTATLIGGDIYLIGSLGYQGRRAFGTTQVYVLDTATFRISSFIATGTPPGWIHGHRARLVAPGEIRVEGGTVAFLKDDGEEEHRHLEGAWVLDVARREWRSE